MLCGSLCLKVFYSHFDPRMARQKQTRRDLCGLQTGKAEYGTVQAKYGFAYNNVLAQYSVQFGIFLWLEIHKDGP